MFVSTYSILTAKNQPKPNPNQTKPKTQTKRDCCLLLLQKVGRMAGILLAVDERDLLLAFIDLGLLFKKENHVRDIPG